MGNSRCVLAPICIYVLPKDIWRRHQVPCYVGLTYGSPRDKLARFELSAHQLTPGIAGGALSELSSSMAADVSDPRAPDLRGLGIMQLLKQVSRRRGSSTATAASTTGSHSTATAASPSAGLEVALARLAGSGTASAHPCSALTWTLWMHLSDISMCASIQSPQYVGRQCTKCTA